MGGPRARPMNRYDPGELRRRAPSSGDLAAIRAQRRLKKEREKEEKFERKEMTEPERRNHTCGEGV